MEIAQKLKTLNKNQSKLLNTVFEDIVKNYDDNYDVLVKWLLLGELPQNMIDEFNAENSTVKSTKIKALGIGSLLKNLKNKGLGTDFSKFDNIYIPEGGDKYAATLSNIFIKPNFSAEDVKKIQKAGIDHARLAQTLNEVKFYSTSKKGYVERLVDTYNKGLNKTEKIVDDAKLQLEPIIKKMVKNQLVKLRKDLTEAEKMRVGYGSSSNSPYIMERTVYDGGNLMQYKLSSNATEGTFSILKKVDEISEKVLGEKAQLLLVKPETSSKPYTLNKEVLDEPSFVENKQDIFRRIIAINGIFSKIENNNKELSNNFESYKHAMSGWIDENSSKYNTEEELKKAAEDRFNDLTEKHMSMSLHPVILEGNRTDENIHTLIDNEIRVLDFELPNNNKQNKTRGEYLEALKKGLLEHSKKLEQECLKHFSSLQKYYESKVIEKFNQKNNTLNAGSGSPVIPVTPITSKGGGEELKSTVAFILVDKDNNIINSGEDLDGYLAGLSESKRKEVLDKTTSFVVLGVTDENGNPAPLTKEIVEKVPAPNVQVSNSVKKINNGAFTSNNIEQVTFQEAYELFDTEIEEGAFGPSVKVLACGLHKNKIENGVVVETKPEYKYFEFTPEGFARSVNSNSLHKIINKKVYTPYATQKPVVHTEAELEKETKVPEEKATQPTQQPTKTRTKKYFPFALDHDRRLNSGWGKFLKWTIKHPVWSTIAITAVVMLGVVVASPLVPALSVFLSSLGLVSTSIVVGGLLVAGAIQIGKQFAKVFSKRYRSMFLKDKAMKINKKIRTNLQKIHGNLDRVNELMSDEVGRLHGNATKSSGQPVLSSNDKTQIKSWHKEYVRILQETKKLKKEADKQKTKLDTKMKKITSLESEIGGENEEKKTRREKNINTLNETFKTYEDAIKGYGKLYRVEGDQDEGESTKENIFEYYLKKKGTKSQDEQLDSAETKMILENVKKNLDELHEDVHSVEFQDKCDYNNEITGKKTTTPTETPKEEKVDESTGKELEK